MPIFQYLIKKIKPNNNNVPHRLFSKYKKVVQSARVQESKIRLRHSNSFNSWIQDRPDLAYPKGLCDQTIQYDGAKHCFLLKGNYSLQWLGHAVWWRMRRPRRNRERKGQFSSISPQSHVQCKCHVNWSRTVFTVCSFARSGLAYLLFFFFSTVSGLL